MKHKACIGLSHQSAVINKKSPKSKKADPIGKAVLNNYAPVTEAYGFHFEKFDSNIFTPVIRDQIRNAICETKKYYTVYLPAYSDERIIKVLSTFKNVEWEVFSKHTKKEYKEKNIHIHPINNDGFINSLLNCKGILCGAGFETPAEALYLKKKLLVIPMKGQYEQQCNAAALKKIGVPVIKSLKQKHIATIQAWLDSDQFILVDYPDETEKIIDMVLKKHGAAVVNKKAVLGESIYSVKKLKNKSLGKILLQLAD
jgi:uncharacterized protein (TIGR00661 family)